MELFVTIIALAFLYVWGDNNPLHKDSWYHWWTKTAFKRVSMSSDIAHFAVIALPLVALALFVDCLIQQSIWLALPLAVIILLYSFGRGEFFEIVQEYTQACYVEDWSSATNRAARFDVEYRDLKENNWSGLHEHVFDEAAYRGFERMFSVLFWFFVLGPVGALMYRLVFLHAQKVRASLEEQDTSLDEHDRQPAQQSSLASRWLWILEWPAVRLLGLSFALTGNFSGCIRRWREAIFCFERSTRETLSSLILGALSVDDDIEADCDITRKELTLMTKLYQRTLWLWLGAVSFVIIFT